MRTTDRTVISSQRRMTTEAEQLQRLRNAVYAIVNALGAALPRTPEVLRSNEGFGRVGHRIDLT